MRQRFEVSQFLKTTALVGGLLVISALSSGCTSTGQFAPHQAFKQSTVPGGFQNYPGYAQPGVGQAQYNAAYGQQSQFGAGQFYGQQQGVPSPFVTGGQPTGFSNNGFSGQC